MAYKVFWIIEDRVICLSLLDDVKLDDFRDSSKQIADYLEEAYSRDESNIIIGIIDLTDARLGVLMRSAISSAQDIYSVIDPRHWKAKPGFVVLVTVSDVAKLLTSVVIRVSRQPMTTVESMNEALTVVRYMYPELETEIDDYQASNGSAGMGK